MKCPAKSAKPASSSKTLLLAERYWDFVSRGLIPEEHKRIVQQSLNTRSASRPSTLSFPLIQDVMEGICKHSLKISGPIGPVCQPDLLNCRARQAPALIRLVRYPVVGSVSV